MSSIWVKGSCKQGLVLMSFIPDRCHLLLKLCLGWHGFRPLLKSYQGLFRFSAPLLRHSWGFFHAFHWGRKFRWRTIFLPSISLYVAILRGDHLHVLSIQPLPKGRTSWTLDWKKVERYLPSSNDFRHSSPSELSKEALLLSPENRPSLQTSEA